MIAEFVVQIAVIKLYTLKLCICLICHQCIINSSTCAARRSTWIIAAFGPYIDDSKLQKLLQLLFTICPFVIHIKVTDNKQCMFSVCAVTAF